MELTPDKYAERLTETSGKKLELLQQMLVLTRRQSEIINEDGIDTLEKIVEGKQKLIDEINKLDEAFDVYFSRLKSALKVKSLDEIRGTQLKGVKQLQDTIGQITDLIKEISGIEKINNIKAKSLLQSLGNEIKKVNQGKKMNSAYRPVPTQVPSYFIDKKK